MQEHVGHGHRVVEHRLSVRTHYRLSGRIGFGRNQSLARFNRRRHDGDLVKIAPFSLWIVIVVCGVGSPSAISPGRMKSSGTKMRTAAATSGALRAARRIFRRHGRLQQPEIRAPGAAAEHESLLPKHQAHRSRSGPCRACAAPSRNRRDPQPSARSSRRSASIPAAPRAKVLRRAQNCSDWLYIAAAKAAEQNVGQHQSCGQRHRQAAERLLAAGSTFR